MVNQGAWDATSSVFELKTNEYLLKQPWFPINESSVTSPLPYTLNWTCSFIITKKMKNHLLVSSPSVTRHSCRRFRARRRLLTWPFTLVVVFVASRKPFEFRQSSISILISVDVVAVHFPCCCLTLYFKTVCSRGISYKAGIHIDLDSSH